MLDLFREKGYVCGYLTTNGTIINEERAEALADLAARGLPQAHQRVDRRSRANCTTARAGVKGTFERTCAGLRRLQEAARRKHAPLRVSINTTVAQESLEALDAMVDVADELGVDAIGLNHLMFSTPEEVAETVRLIGADDPSVISTYVTPDPGLNVARVKRAGRGAGREMPASATSSSTTARRCIRQLIENYYTPGAKLEGRCLYPFLHARVGFSAARSTSARSSASKSATSTTSVARGDLERADVRRAATTPGRERYLSGLPALLQGRAVAGAAWPQPFPEGAAPRRAIPLTVVQ